MSKLFNSGAASDWQLQAVLNAATEISIIATDTLGLITMFNRGSERMLGYTADEVVGVASIDLFHLETEVRGRGEEMSRALGRNVSGFDVFVENVKQTGAETREWFYVRKDGDVFLVKLTITIIHDEQDRVIGYLGVAEDISERKAMEIELIENKNLLGSILESIPNPIFYKNADGVYVNCNKAFSSYLGIPREKIIGSTVYDIAPKELADIYHHADMKLMRERDPQVYEAQVRYADGLLRDVLFYKSLIWGNNGSLQGLVGVMLDVTDRKRIETELHEQAILLEQEIAEHQCAEETLRESEEQLRVIFETSQASIFLVSPVGRIIFANHRMAEMFGCTYEELIGSHYQDYLHPSEKMVGGARMRKLIDGEIDHVSTERHYVRKDGGDFWGYLSGRRLEGPDGNLRALVGIITNITDLKKAKDDLEKEKERLGVTLRSIGDGVITVDTDERIVMLNRVAEQLCGWSQEEAKGKILSEVFHMINEKSRAVVNNPVGRVLKTGMIMELTNHTILVARDGSERVIADSAAPILDQEGAIIGVVLVLRDMTEKKEIEEELFKARKLDSLGILAGGIAHDFNNLLTGILGNVSMARMIIPPDHDAYLLLDRAQKASERARDLTQQLLTFSKGGAPVKRLTGIEHILVDSATFALRGSNVRCEFAIPADLWPAEIDAGQMSQVINNLVINADQAMPDGGVISIQAENIETFSDGDNPDDGRKIQLTIKDTGIGILEEHLQRIFDPYFTTKHHGSGLGLATVYSIVKNHNGEIRVVSQTGVGTTFIIRLPASPTAPTVNEKKVDDHRAGKGKILFMDDEEMIRESMEVALKMLGYEPTVCGDGIEAVELYRQATAAGTPFAGVIMDLTIPGGVGGKDAIAKLLEIDPAARVIVSSGYSSDPIMAHYAQYGFCGAISKPYNCKELGASLREILENNPG